MPAVGIDDSPISFDDEIIHWSGFVFSFWAERGGERILCKVKREAIRDFPEFKHANRRRARQRQ